MKLTNIEKKSDLSFFIKLDRKGDANQRFLLLSDLHIDNPKCDRKLLMKVFNQAKEENAIIFIFGDLFCLMQGKGDPRRSKADIRPEHNKPNYIDAVVKETHERQDDDDLGPDDVHRHDAVEESGPPYPAVEAGQDQKAHHDADPEKKFIHRRASPLPRKPSPPGPASLRPGGHRPLSCSAHER